VSFFERWAALLERCREPPVVRTVLYDPTCGRFPSAFWVLVLRAPPLCTAVDFAGCPRPLRRATVRVPESTGLMFLLRAWYVGVCLVEREHCDRGGMDVRAQLCRAIHVFVVVGGGDARGVGG